MNMLLDAVIWGHVLAGFTGLAAFWVPVFARKGGQTHVRFGRIYAYCAYVVTLSAIAVSLGRILQYRLEGISIANQPEPYGFAVFLGYLGVSTFASVHHAIRVIRTRKTPERIRTPFHTALAWTSIGASVAVITVALFIWSPVSTILLALSPVGLIVGTGILRFMKHGVSEHMGWFYSHMGSMIGGGIAFHTAFAVFGAQRLFEYSLAGPLGVAPWILPALIGIPASMFARRYYQRRFVRPQVQTA
jgi:hypothetical protein